MDYYYLLVENKLVHTLRYGPLHPAIKESYLEVRYPTILLPITDHLLRELTQMKWQKYEWFSVSRTEAMLPILDSENMYSCKYYKYGIYLENSGFPKSNNPSFVWQWFQLKKKTCPLRIKFRWTNGRRNSFYYIRDRKINIMYSFRRIQKITWSSFLHIFFTDLLTRQPKLWVSLCSTRTATFPRR